MRLSFIFRSFYEALFGLRVAFHFNILSTLPRLIHTFKSYRLKLEFKRLFPYNYTSEIDLLSECAFMLTFASIGVPLISIFDRVGIFDPML